MDERVTDDSEPKPRRIDVVTRLAIVRVHHSQPEMSAADLGAMFGVSESSVRRILAVQAADRRETVRAMLLSEAAEVLEEWRGAVTVAAAKGFHQPARDYLVAADAIDARPAATVQVDARPQVLISLPFQLGAVGAGYQPSATPSIEVQPVPQLPVPAPDSSDRSDD